MEHADINIKLDRDPPDYHSGQLLSGEAHISHYQPLAVKRVEVSVLWYTIGTGTEDRSAIYRDNTLENRDISGTQTIPFEVELPMMPQSYHGRLIKIQWAVQVRIYPKKGKDYGAELRFKLGENKAMLAETLDDDAGFEW